MPPCSVCRPLIDVIDDCPWMCVAVSPSRQPAAHALIAADPAERDRGQRAAAVRRAELVEIGRQADVGGLELLQSAELSIWLKRLVANEVSMTVVPIVRVHVPVYDH